jgi:hypothetical protein
VGGADEDPQDPRNKAKKIVKIGIISNRMRIGFIETKIDIWIKSVK